MTPSAPRSTNLLSVFAIVLGGLGVVALALSTMMFVFTSGKLDKMLKVRGEIPGATFVERKVLTVEPQPPDRCWLTWDEPTPPRGGFPRTNVAPERCTDLSPGDAITIAYVDGSSYVKGGIYASDGNLAFDNALLLVWTIGFVVGGSLVVSALVCFVLSRRKKKVSRGALL